MVGKVRLDKKGCVVQTIGGGAGRTAVSCRNSIGSMNEGDHFDLDNTYSEAVSSI